MMPSDTSSIASLSFDATVQTSNQNKELIIDRNGGQQNALSGRSRIRNCGRVADITAAANIMATYITVPANTKGMGRMVVGITVIGTSNMAVTGTVAGTIMA